MPYCPQCGAEVGTDTLFCSSCGERLEESIGDTSEDDPSEFEFDETTDSSEQVTTADKETEEPDSGRDINWTDVGIALGLGAIPASVDHIDGRVISPDGGESD